MWSVKPIDTHLSRFWPINSGLAWAYDLLDNPLNWPPHQTQRKWRRLGHVTLPTPLSKQGTTQDLHRGQLLAWLGGTNSIGDAWGRSNESCTNAVSSACPPQELVARHTVQVAGFFSTLSWSLVRTGGPGSDRAAG